MEHLIDATGRTLGRVASEAAKLLLAKNATNVKKNVVANVVVRVTHASKLSISDKKRLQKTYHSHSGYPGSARALSLAHIITTKGHKEALLRAVKGMLPGNTLREKRLKHLIIED
ncbi:MAG: uL13 family ribosomal protein [bacterium]|nr:uL13 family ribosomal protein [bacterium]